MKVALTLAYHLQIPKTEAHTDDTYPSESLDAEVVELSLFLGNFLSVLFQVFHEIKLGLNSRRLTSACIY